VCFLGGYRMVRAAAELHGIDPSTLPNVEVREHHWGLIMTGGDRVSYGELGEEALDWAYFSRPIDAPCFRGARLALVFAAVEPLAGGRLVDLDGGDPLPRSAGRE
jgi:hypothetical protein